VVVGCAVGGTLGGDARGMQGWLQGRIIYDGLSAFCERVAATISDAAMPYTECAIGHMPVRLSGNVQKGRQR